MDEHSEAIEYDLLTRTQYSIDDVGGVLSWNSLFSFIHFLGSDSALARDLGKQTGWEGVIQTNTILADIYDLLQVINANLVGMASHGKVKKNIKPYPRPGREQENKRKLGSGAMPLNELSKWFEEKRKNGRRI